MSLDNFQDVNVSSLQFEWKGELDSKPSLPRVNGFKDAIDPFKSWNNVYEYETEKWNLYAKGFDEGKDILRKRMGDEEVRKKIVELLTLVVNYTPDNSVYGDIEVDKDTPFFTETYLYALIGKQSARTVLAKLWNLVESCGFEREEIQRKVNQKLK